MELELMKMKKTINSIPMKKILSISAVTLVACFCFVSCNKEQDVETVSATHSVQFVANPIESKTSMSIEEGIAYFAWDSEDENCVQIFESGNKGTVIGSLDPDTKKMSFLATFDGENAPENAEYFAHLNSDITNQSPSANSYDRAADVLVATAINCISTKADDRDYDVTLTFEREVAINKMTLKGLGANETIKSVTVSADQNISGKYQKDTWTEQANTISISPDGILSDESGKAVIYFTTLPVTNAQLYVFVKTISGSTEKQYSKKFTNAITLSKGAVKSFGVTVAESEHTIMWDSYSDWNGVTLNGSSTSGSETISLNTHPFGYSVVLTKDTSSQTNPTVNKSNNDCRQYTKGTVTISNSTPIRKLVFYISDAGKKRLAEITANVGTIEEQTNEADCLIWSGNSNSVTFTVGEKAIYGSEGETKAGQFCFSYIDDYSIETSKKPSLTSSCVFTTNPFEVTITNNEAGATVFYTTDGTTPTMSSSSFTGESLSLQILETTTISAFAAIDGKLNSDIVSATYSFEEPIANTAETAYTTAQAINLIINGSTQLTSTKVYVKGTISQIDAFNSDYGSITYWLDNNTFEVYGGLNKNGTKFLSIQDLTVEDEVVVYGIIKKFTQNEKTTYEFTANNVLISRDTKTTQTTPTFSISSHKESMKVGDADDTFTVSYNGDGIIEVSSSDKSVATAVLGENNTITVSAIAAGTTTITVSAPKTDKFFAVSTQYTLTVLNSTEIITYDYSKTYSYGLDDWGLTNYSDKSNYYLVPSGSDPSVATINNVLANKTVTSDVVITINCATYGSGTNPSASTFSVYSDSNTTTNVNATKGGTLPTSSTYTDVTYTVSVNDISKIKECLAIKITKPGKQIRLKSITITFKYTE